MTNALCAKTNSFGLEDVPSASREIGLSAVSRIEKTSENSVLVIPKHGISGYTYNNISWDDKDKYGVNLTMAFII